MLGKIEYENFIADMRVGRRFIEAAAALCVRETEMNCLLIRRRGGTGGVLIVPERGGLVKWAAYKKDAESENFAYAAEFQ